VFQQGKHSLALFPCHGKVIWSVVKINQRDTDKDEGYQRVLSPARAKVIAGFIDRGNLLPTTVLVSFDTAEIVHRGGHTYLKVPNVENAGWVIDGQHRLAGAHQSQNDLRLPVVAFVKLPLEEQIACFVTINKEQKGVPSSLYLDLLKNLPEKRSAADIANERAVDLADLLKRDEESPFFKRIVLNVTPHVGQISLTNFTRKFQPLVKPPNGTLYIYRDDDRAGIVNNYYRGLSRVFPKDYDRPDPIFFKTVGFGAMINCLPLVLSLAITNFKGFRVADVVSVFKNIDFFDFESWRKIGTGNDAENVAAGDLRAELEKAFAIGTESAGSAIKLK
jgi:DGQHR domain-containing protein